jgi:hypothetical protein
VPISHTHPKPPHSKDMYYYFFFDKKRKKKIKEEKPTLNIPQPTILDLEVSED